MKQRAPDSPVAHTAWSNVHNPIDTTRASAHELAEGSLIYDPCIISLVPTARCVQIGREFTVIELSVFARCSVVVRGRFWR